MLDSCYVCFGFTSKKIAKRTRIFGQIYGDIFGRFADEFHPAIFENCRSGVGANKELPESIKINIQYELLLRFPFHRTIRFTQAPYAKT